MVSYTDRNKSSPPASKYINRTVNTGRSTVEYVCVDHRRAQIVVPEEFLDGSQGSTRPHANALSRKPYLY